MAGLIDGIYSAAESGMNDIVHHADYVLASDIYKYQGNDFYEGFQWVACLDSKTCIECANLDGNIYSELP
jgi:hypothetical protein